MKTKRVIYISLWMEKGSGSSINIARATEWISESHLYKNPSVSTMHRLNKVIDSGKYKMEINTSRSFFNIFLNIY